jgi:RsiW-degrading membrane proteinase PrsW (M82 family)
MVISAHENSQPNASQASVPIHWPSLWQFGLSLLAALLLWALGVGILLMVLNNSLSAVDLGNSSDVLPMVLMGSGILFTGVLLLPSAGFALLRLLHKPNTLPVWQPRAGWLALALLLALVTGYAVSRLNALTWLLLPPLHLAALSTGVLLLLLIGTRRLPLGPAQRAWGIFGSGLVLAPAFSLLLEMIALFWGALFLGLYLSRDPAVFDLLRNYAQPLSFSLEPSDEVIAQLTPRLLQPGILFLGGVFGAVLVPLIEETLKPIGLWLIARRSLTPVEGFVAGMLSGAGYALFENFALGAGAGEGWALLVIARIGTSAIHILTAGLTGWALTLAWREGRYLRLAAAFFTAVALHALWNGLVLLILLPTLLPAENPFPAALTQLGMAAPLVLLLILAGSFGLLRVFNLAVRRAIIPPAPPPAEAENSSNKENPSDGNTLVSD